MIGLATAISASSCSLLDARRRRCLQNLTGQSQLAVLHSFRHRLSFIIKSFTQRLLHAHGRRAPPRLPHNQEAVENSRNWRDYCNLGLELFHRTNLSLRCPPPPNQSDQPNSKERIRVSQTSHSLLTSHLTITRAPTRLQDV
jgi:hypothetical protein